MKTNDIRIGDLVLLRENLDDADAEKIRKFAKRISGQEEMYNYVDDFLEDMYDNARPARVWKCNKTAKIPTEYAYLISQAGVHIPIQTRYLILNYRKPAHPLTNVFQD